MTINGLVSSGSDISSLFSGASSFSTGAVSGSSFSLADYSSIRNGSYGKVLKAYYAKQEKESTVKNSSTSSDTAKTLAAVESKADSLKDSADALIKNGSKSVFAKKDTNAVYNSVKSFADSYNALVKEAGDANSSSVLRETLNMTRVTAANSKMLSQAGITINKDNTLSVDEAAFKKADMNVVKSLFNGNGSYAYQVSAKASMIDYYAENEASKNSIYTGKGNYSKTDTSSGNILDAYL